MIEANPQIFERALDHLKRGRPADAERLLRQLLVHAHVIDRDYEEWLRAAIEAYRQLGRPREVGHGLVYLRRFAEARAAFPPELSAADIASCRELEARGMACAERSPEQSRPLRIEAARGYAEAGRHVHAAIAFGAAGANRDALRSWEHVLADPRLRGKPYEQALCHFNLGVAARRLLRPPSGAGGEVAGERAPLAPSAPPRSDAEAANRHIVSAQRLLEEVADDFESRGERERAFDCYAILLQLGLGTPAQEGGARDALPGQEAPPDDSSASFENLAEGYINCIRVLKEDNLKFYVLQYYEDFLRIALEREEFHAAATVFREAADYARRAGLIYDRGYMKRGAETWGKAAEKNERDGGAVELTENALLAAIDCWNSLGDFFHVRETYQRLAALGLPEKKKRRYAVVATRYATVSAEPVDAAAFPDYLRQQHAYPPIWELDLIEWELDGDHAAVCATIVGDARYADMIRRRALNVLLTHLDARGAEEDPNVLAQIAQGMGELQAYPALRPLERLYGHPHPLVRRGVMKALRHLYFKRTFTLVARGLRDDEKEVREAALEAVAALHFPHAFDPLTRIFREHEDPRVRGVALESLGAIATLEAGVFLLEVLRYEDDPLREVARRLLARFDNPDIFPILRKHMEMEGGPARTAIEQILRAAPTRPVG
ncbi:MAG: hypothetical protein EXR72_19145 [Myxococcales bacterium]|nr:hypothetical protein [Myxococcales bacterium]